MVFRLATSNLITHRIRVALTVSAIALSVSLVVAVTSGYTSADAAAKRALAVYMGSTDAQITLAGATQGGIDESLLQEIEKDTDVERVDGRLEIESRVLNDKGEPVPGRSMQFIGINRPHDVGVETLRMDAGQWFDRPDGNYAVIDQVAAQRIGTDVGENFILPSPDGQLRLQVVGRIHKPGLLAT